MMEIVDPDASTESAIQALQWCVNMGHQDILQALLKTHFTHRKLSDMAEQCVEVLVRVVQAGSCDLLQQLLPYVDDSFLSEIDQNKDRNHVTKLLCIAVEKGSDKMVDILTERGGDVDSFYHGKPLLHLSLTLGHVSIARKLVSAGANVAAIDKRGESVLIPAICSSIEEKDKIIYWLLQKGIDARHKGSSGKEPIHIAAAHSGSAIKQLVDTGCDVNVQDEVNGDTPLHIACGLCCPETVKTLIKFGAKINIQNRHGETPLAKLLKFALDYHNFHSKTRLKIAKNLVKIGFRISKNNSKTLQHKHKRGRNKLDDVYKNVMTSSNVVFSLQHMCRLEIRDHLPGVRFQDSVQCLEIPHHLKEYITFQDLCSVNTIMKF